MGSIGRYIFRNTLAVFVLVLVSLTALIWTTQALRQLDLMTAQGQAVAVFLGITSLVIPQLVMLLAPFALMIAVAYVLNKFTADSEIVVMNSAGMSPWLVFRAFLAAAAVVVVLVVSLSVWISPLCLRELRNWATQVRADVVANILQPGRFTTIEPGLTFHFRARQPDGLLLGIFVNDRRNPKEAATFIAERGAIATNADGTFLVVEDGSVQRPGNGNNSSFVQFDRYAFDLSRFTNNTRSINYAVRERDLFDLANPDPNDPVFQREPNSFRAEFHDRLLLPLYPLAFAVIAFAYLGAPRTTRQNRAAALAGMVVAAFALRLAGFISLSWGLVEPAALVLQYAAFAFAFACGLGAIARGKTLEPPAAVARLLAAATTRFSQRLAVP